MSRKWVKIIAILIFILSGSYFVYNKLTKPNLGPKTTKLYKHGFLLLEEQIGTYIKEHYTGIEKIEFSPIYVTEEGATFSNAYVRPTIYDKYGNKATLGDKIKKFIPLSYGLISDIVLDFDGGGNEVIELLDSNGKPVDVSNEEHLPKRAILTEASSTDENIELLVEDGQLIGVVKDDKGSPGAEIVYNTELHKGDARE
ncbi:hypothetical protein GMC85_01285 [Streptococcus parasanguinis]|uniref:hypothetical protein n=1 Tax=Streptococcus parasanguinis TaxID=1318 RepID=UPI0012BC7E7B|nr:hypothetical protein [Streptococcus parasanguinis]MTR53676.1 hypothetical protein [Streptococcus parasanguinis]MTR55811.1 hypothetical protein [Streptococcus parasanguinis]MTR60635.1 hypothetical protein [Streptococcus parasanguinis]MTR70368.1 hypothetical protein [Streptococcus parasanguinis]MTS02364.1 hypothetical protein [Streptococcus parasanguinis]